MQMRQAHTQSMGAMDQSLNLKAMMRKKDGTRSTAMTGKPVRATSMQRLQNTGDATVATADTKKDKFTNMAA